MKSGGNAGAGVSVKIRGVKSFGSNEPLYIIDGFPGDIDNVNPQDIQSMEVLKDGAAAAIYGSVAANGVVIITTKNGKKGETHIDFNTYLSMTTVANKLEMVNAEQYKSNIKTMFENYNAQFLMKLKVFLLIALPTPVSIPTGKTRCSVADFRKTICSAYAAVAKRPNTPYPTITPMIKVSFRQQLPSRQCTHEDAHEQIYL